MIRRILCWLLLGCGWVITASAENSPAETKIFLDSVQDWNAKPATVSEWFITPQKLDQLPAFNPLADDAPLPLKQAVAIARGDLQKNLNGSETWSLTSAELVQIDRGNSGVAAPGAWVDQKNGKWYYKITFSVQRSDPVTKLFTYPYQVYVLMDGTMSEYRVRPQTKQEAEDEERDVKAFGRAVPGADKKPKRRE